MHLLRRLVRAASAGALAGLAALAVDELLIFLTLGYPVLVAYRFIAAYLGLAAALAVAVELGTLLRRRPSPGGFELFALATALIYAPAIFERVHHALGSRLAPGLALVASALVVCGYGFWIMLLKRFASRSDRGLPPLLGAVTAAVGLAVNRNLVDYPLEAKALAADAAVLTGVLGLALVARAAGSRRALGALAALTAAATAFATVHGWRPPPPVDRGPAPHPNLVLLLIDTLRQDVFQAVVEETAEGRAFHEAMGTAAWFTQAISASPWTVPSVGSMMTGLYPQEHGFDATPSKDPSRPLRPLPESIPTLAEELRRRGYWTGAIVANPLLQPQSGIARGFTYYEVLSGATVKLPPLTALARLGWIEEIPYQQAGSVRRRMKQRLPEMTASGRPVFLWLHLLDPHYPLHEHRDLAPDPAAANLPLLNRAYRDEVRYALAELTRMLEMLHSHGLWEDSVVVVASDHGEMFPSDRHVNRLAPGFPKEIRYGHGHALYDELVRVPLGIRPANGLPAERRIDVLASHTDLWGTVADLLDLDLPRLGGDRVSLAPWLTRDPPTAEPRKRHQTLISGIHYGPEQRALRTPELKLIDYPRGEHPSELYRLDRDPGEQRDVAGTRTRLLADTLRKLDLYESRLREPPETRARELDAETMERLKALGYLQ